MNTETTNAARTGQAAHTPTPWRADLKCSYVEGSDGEAVADCFGSNRAQAKSNATFIVRACNSHAALVSALENAGNVLAALATGQLKEIKPDSAALAQARAALALAKGGQQ